MTDSLILAVIEAELGSEMAAALERAFAGTRIYLPEHPHEEHPLSAALGLEAARALCGAFGGEFITVPNRSRREDRAARIAQLRAKGVPCAAIAQAVGVTERHVYRVLRRLSAREEREGG